MRDPLIADDLATDGTRILLINLHKKIVQSMAAFLLLLLFLKAALGDFPNSAVCHNPKSAGFVALSCDRENAQGALATIQSILRGSKDPCSLQIYLVTNSKDIPFFRDGCECLQDKPIDFCTTNFKIVPLPQKLLASSHKSLIHYQKRKDLSNPLNYVRFHLQEILPSEAIKVAYMDCDVIVNEDIANLLKEDLQGYAGGFVARDIPVVHPAVLQSLKHPAMLEKLKELGKLSRLKKPPPPFNAGVMLLDIRRWKELGITEEALGWIQLNNKLITAKEKPIYIHGSQPPMYLVFLGGYARLSEKWNIQKITKDLGMKGILHWNGPEKPWLNKLRNDTAWEAFRVPENCVFQSACSKLGVTLNDSNFDPPWQPGYFPGYLPCPLADAHQPIFEDFQVRKQAILTVTDSTYLDIAKQWDKNFVARNDLKVECFIGQLDQSTCMELEKAGSSCACLVISGLEYHKTPENKKEEDLFNPSYTSAVKNRFYFILLLLDAGYDVLYVDIDVFPKSKDVDVFLRSLFNLAHTYDIVMQDPGVHRARKYEGGVLGVTVYRAGYFVTKHLQCFLEQWKNPLFQRYKAPFRSQPRFFRVMEEVISLAREPRACRIPPAEQKEFLVHFTGFLNFKYKLACAKAAGYLLPQVASGASIITFGKIEPLSVQRHAQLYYALIEIAGRCNVIPALHKALNLEGEDLSHCRTFDMAAFPSNFEMYEELHFAETRIGFEQSLKLSKSCDFLPGTASVLSHEIVPLNSNEIIYCTSIDIRHCSAGESGSA